MHTMFNIVNGAFISRSKIMSRRMHNSDAPPPRRPDPTHNCGVVWYLLHELLVEELVGQSRLRSQSRLLD